MSRCQMIRTFGSGADAEPVRCSCDTTFDDEKFCYLCSKYSKHLTEPYSSDSNNGLDDESMQVTALQDNQTGQVYWRKYG